MVGQTLQLELFMFLCVLELAFVEPGVDKGNACSNLCEEYCEHFQLIFILLLISPEYSFFGHFSQHRAHTWCFSLFVEVDCHPSTDCHWHSHSHHENIYATCKPLFSSLPAMPYSSPSIHNVCEGDITTKHKTLCSHFVLQPTFSNVTNQQSIGINNIQHLITTMPQIIELTLKRHHECYQLLTSK
jgi:hypothetical protein